VSDIDVIHPCYRHLSREIRLAGLSVTQWSYIVVAVFVTFVLARILPFSDTYNLSVAVTLAGTPTAATVAGAAGDVHFFAYVRSLTRWRRTARRYAPGLPSPRPAGYVIEA
jgi:hypothetical protein